MQEGVGWIHPGGTGEAWMGLRQPIKNSASSHPVGPQSLSLPPLGIRLFLSSSHGFFFCVLCVPPGGMGYSLSLSPPSMGNLHSSSPQRGRLIDGGEGTVSKKLGAQTHGGLVTGGDMGGPAAQI